MWSGCVGGVGAQGEIVGDRASSGEIGGLGGVRRRAVLQISMCRVNGKRGG